MYRVYGKKLISILKYHETRRGILSCVIEYEIIGEGSQISTNQKRENSAFSLLIGRNLRPFPDNFVLYNFTLCFGEKILR